VLCIQKEIIKGLMNARISDYLMAGRGFVIEVGAHSLVAPYCLLSLLPTVIY